jgi:hypothetical protein
MNITTSQEQDYVQDILDAVREIQDTPGLKAEVATRPESVMDRLGLSGVVRHTVAFAFAASIVVGPAATNHIVHTDGFWRS